MRNHDYRKAESHEMRKDIGTTPSVWFGLLGPLEARVGGQTVHLGTQRERRLLLALLSDPTTVVLRITAEEWVWDNEAGRKDALSEVVSDLRQRLTEAGVPYPIVAKEGWLRLDLPPQSTDLGCFRELVAQAEKSPAAEQYDLFREAMRLVRGEPFAEVHGQLGVGAFREKVKDEVMVARIRLFEVSARLGRHPEHLGAIKSEFERAPSNHRLAVLSMAAHYRMGMTKEALATYLKHARQARDLGIPIRAELQELQRRILQDDPDLREDEGQHMNEADGQHETTGTGTGEQPTGVTNNIYGAQTINGAAIFGNSTAPIHIGLPGGQESHE